MARAVTTHDLVETRERADKVKAAARHGEDPAARRARLRARRRWSEFCEDEMVAVSGRFSPEDFAAVRPVIDAFGGGAFEQARHDGLRDSTEAYRADGVLAALAAAGETIGITFKRTTKTAESTETAASKTEAESIQTAAVETEAESVGTAAPAESTPTAARSESEAIVAPAESTPTAATEPTVDEPSELEQLLAVRPGRVKWNVTILVDAIALKRGYATASETCEIPGVGPVDARWVSRILPESIVDVLVHDLNDIQAYATITRKRKKALDKTLKARDRRCVVPGCQTAGSARSRPPPRVREARPDIERERPDAVRQAPRREDPPRRPHRPHRHRMALVPTTTQARRTRTAPRIHPVEGPDR